MGRILLDARDEREGGVVRLDRLALALEALEAPSFQRKWTRWIAYPSSDQEIQKRLLPFLGRTLTCTLT